jgi:hypothetical protein
MSLGGAITYTQALSQYRAMNSALIGQAFSDLLEVSKSNSNILSELQGGVGSKKPFVIKTELTKGAKDTVNFPVAASLGAQARMGTNQAVGYEEQLIQGSWSVRIDNKRVVVGWSDIVAQVATTGKDWKEVYAELCGTRMGQIEQEDMLMILKKRRQNRNIIRPNDQGSLNDLTSADLMDTPTITRAAGLLKSFGAEPAMVGRSRSKRPIQKYILFGADAFLRPIKSETAYLQAVSQGDVRGDDNATFDGDYQTWDGHFIKNWDIVDHDNPGPIGSTILPKAILGDPIVEATTTFTVYGGGRTQASLGDQAAIYAPFQFFPGYLYLNYQEESLSADTNTYYFVVYDPADGYWCVYSYVGSAGNSGQGIAITNRLDSSASGVSVTTLAGWEWDGTQNKTAFPTGSYIFPVNSQCVPFGYAYMWGADVGGKAYGTYQNRRIMNKTDYDNALGFGIQTIYGVDARLDTLGFPRGFVSIEAAVQHEGVTMPVIT